MTENEETWEYGFYDSAHPDLIWWYCFGLPHKTAESAKHTGDKSVWGEAVIVRRRTGSTDWERVAEEPAPEPPMFAGTQAALDALSIRPGVK